VVLLRVRALVGVRVLVRVVASSRTRRRTSTNNAHEHEAHRPMMFSVAQNG
jgi:hypothetical protein